MPPLVLLAGSPCSVPVVGTKRPAPPPMFFAGPSCAASIVKVEVAGEGNDEPLLGHERMRTGSVACS